jgi:hypothetical protein
MGIQISLLMQKIVAWQLKRIARVKSKKMQWKPLKAAEQRNRRTL